MRILDLFSGTGSSTQAFKDAGHYVYTVDIDTDFVADLHADILTLTPNDFPGQWDLIWASPPCTTFSVASIGKHWIGSKKTTPVPKTQQAIDAIKLMNFTKELIGSIGSAYWVVENPRGILRRLDIFGEPKTVWYCQYGDERAKPTDLFGNLPPMPILTCKNGNPDCDHVRAPRGSRTGTQGRKTAKERSMVPYALSLHMLRSMKR